MRDTRRWSAIALSAANIVLLSGSSAAWADTPIYGGPTHPASANPQTGAPLLPIAPGSTAGNGVGVGSAQKIINTTNYGYRPVRWDTTGWVDLGFIGDGTGSATDYAYAINAGGIAVGTAEKYISASSRGTRAVRWDPGTTIPTELGHLGLADNGVTFAYAYAINAGGTIVGAASTFSAGASRGYRAVRWDAGTTTATELGNIGTRPDGNTYCIATAINVGGTAVGWSWKYSGATELGDRALRWDAGTTAAIELGDIGTGRNPFGGNLGFTSSRANAINAGGSVVGFANKYNAGGGILGTRAVRWDAGSTTATELGNLGTITGGTTSSEAYAINDAGTAVGFAQKYVGGASRGFRAVRWDAGGTAATELGILETFGGGISTSYAYAINNAGTTVGYARKYTGGPIDRAVYWGQDGVPIDLNTLLSPADSVNWTLYTARAITDSGWITGIGFFDPDGAAGPLARYSRLFLMQISLTPSCAPCAADFNQDGGIDGADVEAFFADWEAGLPCADTNQDGGIDGADAETFFGVWESGGC